jgi:uncharacterized repeat protein (TIGR03899 family)
MSEGKADFNLIKIDGKPLEKLIDVVSKGIGVLYEPRRIRKEADARAYEIVKLEQAKAIAGGTSGEITQGFVDRLNERLIAKEIQRQRNIDNIVSESAKTLQDETVSEQPVSEDWAIKFFGHAEDIKDETLQVLWGKVLAGEIKHPKSFSLRTLDVLRNLTKEEAETFTRFAQYAITDDYTNYYIFFPLYARNSIYFKYQDRMMLSEVGLIEMDKLHVVRALVEASEEAVKPKMEYITLSYQHQHIKLEITNKRPLNIPVIHFTSTGSQLLNLIKPEYSEEYFQHLMEHLQNIIRLKPSLVPERIINEQVQRGYHKPQNSLDL